MLTVVGVCRVDSASVTLIFETHAAGRFAICASTSNVGGRPKPYVITAVLSRADCFNYVY